MSETRIIYGFHSVTSRLRQSPDSVKELYLDASREDRRVQELVKAAESRGARVMRVDEKRLDGLTHQARHQGVAARIEVAPLPVHIEDVLEIAGEIQLSRLEHFVHAGGFLHQGRGDQRRWQDHDQHDDHHRGEGGQVGPHRPAESPVQRRKDDRQDRPPKNRAVERPEDPRERQRYCRYQQQEGLVFEGAQADAHQVIYDVCGEA